MGKLPHIPQVEIEEIIAKLGVFRDLCETKCKTKTAGNRNTTSPNITIITNRLNELFGAQLVESKKKKGSPPTDLTFYGELVQQEIIPIYEKLLDEVNKAIVRNFFLAKSEECGCRPISRAKLIIPGELHPQFPKNIKTCKIHCFGCNCQYLVPKGQALTKWMDDNQDQFDPPNPRYLILES
jgi:hypothetical protein